jgi:putative transposase
MRSVGRPPLRMRDRFFWILLVKGWREWRTALIIVQPDTVVRWHRQWLRRRWTWRSTRTRPGRPRTDTTIRTLLTTMATANPLWGAPRIHGELCKLGIMLSERTVPRLLRRLRRPPSQTWRTFLTNHVTTLVSMDFFTVPTLTGRVLSVLVLLSHERRRIIHGTSHRRMDGATGYRGLSERHRAAVALADRDAIYGEAFRRHVAGMGISEVITSPSSPWQTPYAETLIGSIRRECLDHVIVLGERHLRRLLCLGRAGRLATY